VQSDGPKNFIDPASREQVGTGSTEEPDHTPHPGPLGLRQLDLQDDERQAKQRKQDAEAEKAKHEAAKAKHEAAKAKHEAAKTRHEATKVRHEANAQEWTAKHARKRSLTNLWRDWIFLGILIIVTLTGVGTIAYGVATETIRAMVTGVALLSGPSGTAILGLTRNRSRNDDNWEPPT
jgi:cation transport ATPase